MARGARIICVHRLKGGRPLCVHVGRDKIVSAKPVVVVVAGERIEVRESKKEIDALVKDA